MLRLSLVSLLCALCNVAHGAGSGSPRVTVTLILLNEPSTVESTTDLSSVGEAITDLDQLTPLGLVYLEAWCQTTEPSGISTAVLDMTYETAFLDTSIEQVTVASLWSNVFGFTSFVDDTAGLIKDVGGISFTGRGVVPGWAKIGTVEFDVLDTPSLGVTFCSQFAGIDRSFGILGLSSVPQKEVNYGCLTIVECTSAVECDDENECTDDSCDPATGCVFVSVPDRECDDGNACTTADVCVDDACLGGPPLVCDNGLFCDGEESCDTELGCQPGAYPCTDPFLSQCDDEDDACIVCLIIGDATGNGVVDLEDFGLFPTCMTSPFGPIDPPIFAAPCGCFDMDIDGDVDLRDFAEFGRLVLTSRSN